MDNQTQNEILNDFYVYRGIGISIEELDDKLSKIIESYDDNMSFSLEDIHKLQSIKIELEKLEKINPPPAYGYDGNSIPDSQVHKMKEQLRKVLKESL